MLLLHRYSHAMGAISNWLSLIVHFGDKYKKAEEDSKAIGDFKSLVRNMECSLTAS